jgi:hypothetical protein
VIRWSKNRKSSRREMEKSPRRRGQENQRGDDLKPRKRGIFFK